MFRRLLLLLVPASLVLEYVVHAPPLWIFVSAVLAIIPLADQIREATEQLAHRVGGAIGGLLNVTFGNAAELLIALFVLRAGHPDVVKAQITGSIIGNSLLGLGLAIVAGSWGRARQTFERERVGLLSSLLVLSVIALMLPALFDYSEHGVRAGGAATGALSEAAVRRLDERLSLGASVILIALYVANLVYTLVTHRNIFSADDEDEGAAAHAWPLWRSIGMLVGVTAVIAWEAELVSGALEVTATQLGLTTFFLGVIVLAVVGNAAEYLSAVYFARKDRMDLVMTITVGSSIQVALLTAPVLVLASWAMGKPMTLVFRSPLELIAIAAVAFSVNAIAQDGETTWFEGVLLLGVYALLGLAFFFVT